MLLLKVQQLFTFLLHAHLIIVLREDPIKTASIEKCFSIKS